MPAIPPASDFTSASNQAGAQAAYAAQRAALVGLLGTDGTVATALATLGTLGGQYRGRATAYTLTAADRGSLIHATGGTWTLGLIAAATAGAGFSFAVLNTGSGVITIDPAGSETIIGQATILLQTGSAAIVVCTGSAWTVLPMAGAGQASSVDATAGRVLRVAAAGGAFGLGNVGTLPLLSDFDSISVPSGIYRWSSSTAGTRAADFATGAGVIEITVQDAGTIIQRVMRNTVTGMNGGHYKRIYASGAWSAWDASMMRSNLLGTVAQSGGVPTGGVIERGATASGEYVRFADGTQICTIGTLSAPNASAGAGAIYRSGDVGWSFPIEFSDASHLVVQASVDDPDAWSAVSGITVTGCNVRVLSWASKSSGLTLRATAIGRWF